LRQGRRGKTFCPFEEFTAISARSCSHPLQRRIVDFYAERSGEKTIVALQEHYGITVSLHAVQNISREAATRAKALNSQVPTQSAPTSKTLIALSLKIVGRNAKPVGKNCGSAPSQHKDVTLLDTELAEGVLLKWVA